MLEKKNSQEQLIMLLYLLPFRHCTKPVKLSNSLPVNNSQLMLWIELNIFLKITTTKDKQMKSRLTNVASSGII